MDYPHLSSTFLNSLLVDWMLFNGWNNNLTFREGGVGAVGFFYCRQISQKKYLDPKCILNLQYIVVGYGV
jgi:cellulose synthase/poly-beta-1,6-N-acetylglucosamine synthase-like glycosyltransferase